MRNASNEVLPFQYGGNQIQVVVHDENPHFILADVCNVLGLKNPSVVVQGLDEDERTKFNLGRQGDTWIITESGLYHLIFKSRKKEAQVFRRWVTKEVLPTIRKTGGYVATTKATAEINRRILKWREMLGSNQALADYLDVSISSLGHARRGNLSILSADMQYRILQGLTALEQKGTEPISTEVLDLIVRIEDHEIRTALFATLKKGGASC